MRTPVSNRPTDVTHTAKPEGVMSYHMRTTHRNVDQLRGVLAAADEPLTAREILTALEDRGETDFENSHQIATVLGRWAERGDITVYTQQPYRYQLEN